MGVPARVHGRLEDLVRRCSVEALGHQPALRQVDRGLRLREVNRRPAGPAHPPRARPGDERRELPPRAQQGERRIPGPGCTGRFLAHRGTRSSPLVCRPTLAKDALPVTTVGHLSSASWPSIPPPLTPLRPYPHLPLLSTSPPSTIPSCGLLPKGLMHLSLAC